MSFATVFVGCQQVLDKVSNPAEQKEETSIKNKIELSQRNPTIDHQETDVTNNKKHVNQVFALEWLSTNTSKISIPLEEILNGGPGKDGIPSIDSPLFLTQDQALESMSYLDTSDEWIVVTSENQARFYSFDILVWHEIVNDTIGDKHIAVTFCPLCGSSIVFDREFDDRVHSFGVSGKLYNSNLLMFDRATESLWSQSRWEALVGEYLGKKLEHVSSNIMNFGTYQNLYPDWLVLSDQTNTSRSYGRQPYGNYAETDDLIFPVNHDDIRLPRKEILYIVHHDWESVAFVRKDLIKSGKATIQTDTKEYQAVYENRQIIVKVEDKVIPWYHEMWFSWITHNQDTKNIWQSP